MESSTRSTSFKIEVDMNVIEKKLHYKAVQWRGRNLDEINDTLFPLNLVNLEPGPEDIILVRDAKKKIIDVVYSGEWIVMDELLAVTHMTDSVFRMRYQEI